MLTTLSPCSSISNTCKQCPVTTSKARTLPRMLQVSTLASSTVKVHETGCESESETHEQVPSTSCQSLVEKASQSWVSRNLAQLENRHAETPPECSKMWMQAPVLTSHTLADQSMEAVARRLQSDDTVASMTMPVWQPVSCQCCCPILPQVPRPLPPSSRPPLPPPLPVTPRPRPTPLLGLRACCNGPPKACRQLPVSGHQIRTMPSCEAVSTTAAGTTTTVRGTSPRRSSWQSCCSSSSSLVRDNNLKH
mmetsp:Transcript_39741/g.101020  ORF Transcript_39741/g.101020 Transcript_39741/m.101020 type:complete len:250 (-) Transcript_39741:213-962(-)